MVVFDLKPKKLQLIHLHAGGLDHQRRTGEGCTRRRFVAGNDSHADCTVLS